jgi:hypothetical protein
MNPLEILEKFGFPASIALGMAYFIWRSQTYIQEDLSKDIANKFERLEGIIIALINQQKKMQIELRGIKAKYEALVDIILKLMRGEKK